MWIFGSSKEKKKIKIIINIHAYDFSKLIYSKEIIKSVLLNKIEILLRIKMHKSSNIYIGT